jgi:hypothetical protein
MEVSKMRTQLFRLFRLSVFSCMFINAFSLIDYAEFFVTRAVAGTSSDSRQCARGQTTKAIDIACPPYNAIADDNQDDSKAFQAAVDALSRSGGTIFVPAGTYIFDNPLLIQKPVHLQGAGPTTILSHNKELSTDGQANFIRIGGAAIATEDVTISDLTIQGPQGKDLRTSMIRIVSNVKGVKIRNLSFRNVSSTCVLIFGSNIQNVEILDNRADEFYEQFAELASGGISGVRIERNVAKATRGHPKLGPTQPYGVVFEPKAPGEINDVSIVGNQISFEGMRQTELIHTGGISLSTGGPVPFLYRRILVKDNIIRTAGVGIRVQTLHSGRVSGPGSVEIAGNRIEGATSNGIQVNVAGDNARSDAVSIIENIVQGYSSQAYYQYDGIRLDGNLVKPEIRGNQILPLTDGGTNAGRYGISIEPGIKNAVIKDNKISGYHMGAISDKSANENINK